VLPFAARRQFAWLCVLAAIAGLLETAAVASVVPFLSVLAQPDLVSVDPRLVTILSTFGIAHQFGSLALLGGLVLFVLVVSNTFSAVTTWLMLRFANRQGHALAVQLLESYLGRPYSFYLDRNTAELQKNILTEAYRITVGTLAPGVQMIAKSFVVIFLFTLLLIINPMLALTVSAVLGLGYFAVYRVVRRLLHRAGRESVEASGTRARQVQESLLGVKEIKLLGREPDFVARFRESSLRWADAQAKAQALAVLPRYAIETLAIGFVLATAIYFLLNVGTVSQALPLLGLYAFTGYRLMPALQQVFAAWAAVRYSGAALDLVAGDLAGTTSPSRAAARPQTRLTFRTRFEFVQVSYRYPGASQWALHDFSLQVVKNTSVGLVGETGCGKTTVVDLAMGLLAPEQGRLCVDGVPLDDTNLLAWQRAIGHVPQQTFLSDDTIARNIALGLPDFQIDPTKVERAARLARLHDFVDTLPHGYDTVVGERGIRLSGGQRQRIAIARALYHDPDLLVLDEATSALDNVTENAVLEALQTLAGRKTIIMVAHRLSTVRGCDLVCLLERGQIAEQGQYDELVRSSPRFRALAAAAG
jgi:ABC-type multidrug transport system fused ATPase/permease subunit